MIKRTSLFKINDKYLWQLIDMINSHISFCNRLQNKINLSSVNAILFITKKKKLQGRSQFGESRWCRQIFWYINHKNFFPRVSSAFVRSPSLALKRIHGVFFSRGAHPSKQEFLFLGRWRRNSFTPRAVSRNMSNQRGKSFQGRAPWWWSFCNPEFKKNEKVGNSNSMFSQKFCFRLCRVPDVLGRFWRSFRTLPVAVVFWNLHINCS